MIKSHHVEKATGVGDPQCFKGEAGAAKFKVGDRVRIRNLPDIFYTRSQMYLREAEAVVVKLVYESRPRRMKRGITRIVQSGFTACCLNRLTYGLTIRKNSLETLWKQSYRSVG